MNYMQVDLMHQLVVLNYFEDLVFSNIISDKITIDMLEDNASVTTNTVKK